MTERGKLFFAKKKKKSHALAAITGIIYSDQNHQ